MKAYHEYLELFSYFALPGDTRLSRADFDSLDAEFRGLASRHPKLEPAERARLSQLKAVLFRDKP